MFENARKEEYISWIQHRGGNFNMRKMEETQMDLKREEIIQRLVQKGVFKINGKQLYEQPLYELMKEYTIRTQ
jgi:Fur-regulated basic protein A